MNRHFQKDIAEDLTLPKVVQGLAARFGRNISAHKVVNDNVPAYAIRTQASFLTGMAKTHSMSKAGRCEGPVVTLGHRNCMIRSEACTGM